MSLESFDLLQFHMELIELSDTFLKIPIPYRETFLHYVQDEYACIDDVFGDLFDTLFLVLYEYSKSSVDQADELCSTLDVSLRKQLSFVQLKEPVVNVSIDYEHIHLALQSLIRYAEDELQSSLALEYSLQITDNFEDDSGDEWMN